MARKTRPLTNTEVLRSKANNKDITLHDADGVFMVVKPQARSSSVFATRGQIAVVAQI